MFSEVNPDRDEKVKSGQIRTNPSDPTAPGPIYTALIITCEALLWKVCPKCGNWEWGYCIWALSFEWSLESLHPVESRDNDQIPCFSIGWELFRSPRLLKKPCKQTPLPIPIRSSTTLNYYARAQQYITESIQIVLVIQWQTTLWHRAKGTTWSWHMKDIQIHLGCIGHDIT